MTNEELKRSRVPAVTHANAASTYEVYEDGERDKCVCETYGDDRGVVAAFIAIAPGAFAALLAEVEQQRARADAAEALAARRAKYNDTLASERNELQMRLWKIDEQAKRIDELEAQLSDAETARDSWRDKHRTCRQVSDPAFADLTRLRKLLAEMENALPERERAIRRELHEWLYPPFEFAASGKAVTP